MSNRLLHSSTILLVFTLVGCTAIKEMSRLYIVEANYDEFEDTWVYQQKYNRNGEWNSNAESLNIRIIKPSHGDKIYQLVIYQEGRHIWLYADNSLQIKADKEILEFPFLSTKSHVLAASKVQKWGYYLANRESIYKILNADRVVAKIYTTDGYYNVEYKKTVIIRMKDFMAQHND